MVVVLAGGFDPIATVDVLWPFSRDGNGLGSWLPELYLTSWLGKCLLLHRVVRLHRISIQLLGVLGSTSRPSAVASTPRLSHTLFGLASLALNVT
jgi:hypothetical protein